MTDHLLFSADDVRCALPLATVRIVIRMVQLTPAPHPGPEIAGMLNFHGQMIPVWSVRSFFGRNDRPPRLTDMLIIAGDGGKSAALWADETRISRQGPIPLAEAENLSVTHALADGVDLTEDGTVLFSDLFGYLSQEPLPRIRQVGSAAKDGRQDGDEPWQ